MTMKPAQRRREAPRPEDEDFGPMYPLYHPKMDPEGIAKGTAVWDAGGSFRPVETIEPGDHVFGIGYRLETTYVKGMRHLPDNKRIKDIWRPFLVARQVLDVRMVRARSWQLSFGPGHKEKEDRRLVAGGATRVQTFPFDHRYEEDTMKRLVDCHTSVPNPRTQQETREAMTIDRERSSSWGGQYEERPTSMTGTVRGELVGIVPYDHYGGITGMIRSDKRDYQRYTVSQARRIDPLQKETLLYQLHVQPCTTEERAASPEKPRANFIAQTPYPKETRSRTVQTDPMANRLKGMDMEGLRSHWHKWHDSREGGHTRSGGGRREETSATRQGMYWSSIENEELANELKGYGITEGGWLNGGILVGADAYPEWSGAQEEENEE